MPVSRISEQSAPALQAYVRSLQSRFGAQLVAVVLFGSQARSEATVDSDVDVMVILLPQRHPRRRLTVARRSLILPSRLLS